MGSVRQLSLFACILLLLTACAGSNPERFSSVQVSTNIVTQELTDAQSCHVEVRCVNGKPFATLVQRLNGNTVRGCTANGEGMFCPNALAPDVGKCIKAVQAAEECSGS